MEMTAGPGGRRGSNVTELSEDVSPSMPALGGRKFVSGTDNARLADMRASLALQRAPSMGQLMLQRAPSMGNMLIRATSFRVPVVDEITGEEIQVEKRNSYFTVAFWLGVVQCLIVFYQIWYYGMAPATLNPTIGPPPEILDYMGSKNSAKIIYWDEEWRLLTSIMMHAGLLHLCINEMIQMRLGIFLETDFGTMQFVTVYVLGAFFGQICSVIALPDQVSVGASGALMGLYGAWVVVLIVRWRNVPKEEWCMRNIQLMIVLLCIAVTMFFSLVSYVDWAAHGGGLMGGTMVACCIFIGECPCRGFVWIARIVMVTFTLGAFASAYSTMATSIEPPRSLLHYCTYLRATYSRQYTCLVDV